MNWIKRVADKGKKVIIVRNPMSAESTLNDVMWTDDIVGLFNVVKGSPGEAAKVENWTLYYEGEEAQAKADAESRLAKVKQ